ncbi:GM17023 [Drosophila sechellia]|uniref:GM17023 n=1 Tax=Drosophila sechellia TaxID=7238 RepID=B4I5S6_DROSE|nr:GM17023 [Drosophila sechellia]
MLQLLRGTLLCALHPSLHPVLIYALRSKRLLLKWRRTRCRNTPNNIVPETLVDTQHVPINEFNKC